MIHLKKISIENIDADNYDEKYYETVATFPSYQQCCAHLIGIINEETTEDTANYYYDVRED